MAKFESRYYWDKYGRYMSPGSYFGYDRYRPTRQYYYYDDPVYTSNDWFLEPRRRSFYRSRFAPTSEYVYRTRHGSPRYWRPTDYYSQYSRYAY